MYLVDTNIWLERLLGQTRSDEVGQFLERIDSDRLFVTDFAFHSICVILTRLKQRSTLVDFVQDVFIDGSVSLVEIRPREIENLVNAMDKYNLDFDDAYQYVSAEQNDLVIVSFDSDFDRTEKGKKSPGEILSAR